MEGRGEDFATDLVAFTGYALDRLDRVLGVGIAVVQGDETLFAGGYGLADLETGRTVDGETAFYIGSATKPFTALALEILDTRGIFDLDRTLADAAPDVDFRDDVPADTVTLRQMLYHTGGIHSDGLSFRQTRSGEWTPEIAWEMLRYLRPQDEADPGEFNYTNSGYNIVTTIAHHELGLSWQDIVETYIHEPLGLAQTSTRIETARNEGRLASAYVAGGSVAGSTPANLLKSDATMQSAGGHIISAHDAARWLTFQVNNGRLDGRQIVEAGIVEATHQPLADIDETHPSFLTREHYGLGWFLGQDGPDSVIYHSGSFTGYAALFAYKPDSRIGVAVMANEDSVGAVLVDIIAEFVFDWHRDPATAWQTGLSRIDSAAGQLRREVMGMRLEGLRSSERSIQLSLPLEAYTGRFFNPEYGTVDIQLDHGALVASMGLISAQLSGMGNDPDRQDWMRVEFYDGEGMVLFFRPQNGEVNELALFSRLFTRVPDQTGPQ
jgi:CubicO group peptidase (beta-lactamase class C family)